MSNNEYGISDKVWDRWSDDARYVFRKVYSVGKTNQELFLYPGVGKIPDCQWETTAHNFAYMADVVKY